MRKLIETKKGVTGLSVFEHYSISKFVEKGNSHIVIDNLAAGEKVLEIKVGDQESTFFIADNFLITALNNGNDISGYDLKTGKTSYSHLNMRVDKKSFEVDKSIKSCITYNHVTHAFYVMDLKTGYLNEIKLPRLANMMFNMLYSNYIISIGESKVTISTSDFKNVFHMDITETEAVKDHFMFGTQHGRIEDVLFLEDRVFILSGNALRCYELSSGKLINTLNAEEEWSFHQVSMLLYNESILFLPRIGIAYRVYDINLNTLSDFITIQVPDCFSPDIDFFCTDWKLHKDALWYVSSRATRYLASLEPLTGKNIECIPVKNAEGNIYEPQFYMDKLLVIDAGSNLYVYQT